MNDLQRTSVILVAGFLLCIFFLNSAMAQSPSKSPESIKTEIIFRSMTARESQNFDNQLKNENQKKSSGQKALDTLNSSSANALYGSADAMIDVAKKNKSYLIENGKKAIKQFVKKSDSVKSIVSKSSGSIKKVLKGLDGLDKAGTGGSFFGSVVEGDTVGAGESLLNATGSGYSAAAGGKAGAFLGSMIAPGPGTVVGGFIGAGLGALTYNEVVAPQVEKAGDYASNKIASGEAQLNNKRLKIQREIKKNFDTVYPHGYLGSYAKDPITGMIYELRPDVLYQKAEKIRQANSKELKEKVDQEILNNKKKMTWEFTPSKTEPGQQTAFKVKKVVPDVRNESLKDAFSILKNAGFILGSPEGGDPAPSKKLVGHVQMQLPAGGQPQYQNKPVVLTLYSDIKVPDVVGLKAIDALKKLRMAGFSMSPQGCDPPPTKELSLLAKEQKPEADTPSKGYDSVTVTFYPEYQNPVVPDITTFELSAAQDILEKIGMRLNPEPLWGEQATTREQVGIIQKQQPAEGEPIEPEGEVKAWIYYTAVPKVITMSKMDAESAMKAAWFVPKLVQGEAVEYKEKWGTIYSQTLAPEKKVAKAGMAVTLKFYEKPKKSSQPTIVGYWEGHEKNNQHKKAILHLDILSVDSNGKFKATFIYPTADYKKLVYGSIKNNKITFIRKDSFLGDTKYDGILSTQHMIIDGARKKTSSSLASALLAVSNPDKKEPVDSNKLEGSFYLKKK
ncbi:MAG: hypothetical protein K9L30_11475 [Desulfobacterales bacterium]|nr:hypothetical protein [Desulfobacterales bacterium]